MNKQNFIFVLITAVLIIAIILVAKTKGSKSEEKGKNRERAKTAQTLPKMEIDKNKKYFAILETDAGSIKIEFFSKETPITVNNFISLAKKKFYDNTIFHRVIPGFMIQGGDPEGTGRGGPGYQFDDEPFTGEYIRGTVAMANSGANTNGSQFFIMHADYDLPKNYVIFGKVIEGMETVDAIANAQTEDNGMGEISKPINPIRITKVIIKEE